jgi:predicted dithiol-disulfide oxidoreductase (DUF899 family)
VKEWLAARTALLAEEKELTRRSDELARERQTLPWVAVEDEYRFQTEDGSDHASLPSHRALSASAGNHPGLCQIMNTPTVIR